MFNFKSFLKKIINGLIAGSIMSVCLITVLLTMFTVNANNIHKEAMKECNSSRTQLWEYGMIEDHITEEDIISNCKTLEDRIKTILGNYGVENQIFYVTGFNETLCGELTVGCLTQLSLPKTELPKVMTIAYTADYYISLEHTVTHEYIHALTSYEEYEKLKKENNNWFTPYGEPIDPAEVVADCGVAYLTGNALTEAGSYVNVCTPEQTKIAIQVIENTYV